MSGGVGAHSPATEAQQHLLLRQASRATAAVIYNVAVDSADTEYSQSLPADTKKFLIRCRETNAIKLAFAVGGSGTTYVTIPSGQSYWEDLVQLSSFTLYFQCAAVPSTVEIIAWI